MNWYRPELGEFSAYTSKYKLCMQMGSESSHLAIWCYVEESNILRAYHRDLYWHQVDYLDRRVWYPPVGEWERNDWPSLLAENVPPGTTFAFMPELLVQRWRQDLGERITIDDMREEWDYLYSIDQQIAMEGQAFANIRKRVKKFLKNNYEYRDVTRADIPELIEFQNAWMKTNDAEGATDASLVSDHHTILKIFEHWEELPTMYGALLKVDGKVVSYALSEELEDYLLSGHLLKGDYNYPGVYQAMNHLLYKNSLSRFSISNDWGDGNYESLRQAKLNWNPIGYIRKYFVTWNG